MGRGRTGSGLLDDVRDALAPGFGEVFALMCRDVLIQLSLYFGLHIDRDAALASCFSHRIKVCFNETQSIHTTYKTYK